MEYDKIQNLLLISDAMIVNREYVMRQILGYTDMEYRRMKLNNVLNKIESKRNEQK